MDDRNTENRKPDEWMTESGGFSEAEETTATGGKRGKAGRTSSGRKISTRPLLVGCMLFLGIAAAGGCWLIYRTGGKTAGAAAEMNMDVGGRITDRLDDVDSSLEENTKLLKDTADFVDSSNAKYDEIKSSLQAIRDQLTEYQSTIGEDGGTGEAAENSGLSTVEVGGAESAEIAYETGRDSEERDVSASIASILAKTEEALQKIEDSRRESSEMLTMLETKQSTSAEDLKTAADEYYEGVLAKNQELESSLDELQSSMEEARRGFETKQGKYYSGLVSILDETGNDLKSRTDSSEKAIKEMLSANLSSLTESVNGLSSQYSAVSRQISSLSEKEDNNMQLLKGSIDDFCNDSGKRFDGVGESVADIADTQKEMYETVDANAENVKDIRKTLEKMDARLSAIEAAGETLAEQSNPDSVREEEHRKLIKVLRSKGLNIGKNASIDEIVSAIDSLENGKDAEEEKNEGDGTGSESGTGRKGSQETSGWKEKETEAGDQGDDPETDYSADAGGDRNSSLEDNAGDDAEGSAEAFPDAGKEDAGETVSSGWSDAG